MITLREIEQLKARQRARARRARKLGVYRTPGTARARPVYRVRVDYATRQAQALVSPILPPDVRGTAYVVAHSALDAADYVRDAILAAGIDAACTTVLAYGPRGGTAERYIGWETAIGAAMFSPRARAQQLKLF